MTYRKLAKPEKLVWARRMRNNPTPAEAALWAELRRFRLDHGIVFRRQVVALGWIVDFWCPKAKLIIEVDGSAHEGREAADYRRARILVDTLGAHLLRFENELVIDYPREVAESILRYAKKRMAGGRRKCRACGGSGRMAA